MTNLTQFATGGALRPDALTGLNGDFSSALAKMFAAAPPEIKSGLQISSAYRSPEVQAGLWQNALAKYGNEAEARRWVAPPGHSQHNHGNAVDLKFASPEAQAWTHQHAGEYGLNFPLGNEAWHIELASARGSQPAHIQVAQTQPVPQVQPQQSVLASNFVPDQQDEPKIALRSAVYAPSFGSTPANSVQAQPYTPTLASMFVGGLQNGLKQMQQQDTQRQQQEQARRTRLAAMLPDPYGANA